MPNKVVVRYLDGRIERGYTTDFQPNRDLFHLIVRGDTQHKPVAIRTADLKAVFFVKELHGLDKDRPVVKREFHEIKDKKIVGKKVRVEFLDGEVLNGITLGYSPQRKGFFFTPIDPESNNERIFAVMTAIKDISFHD